MKLRPWSIVALLAISSIAVRAADWQVVLLKPPGCDTCMYVEEMLKRRAQIQQASLMGSSGDQVTAGITRRSSAQLSPQEWTQLRALPWFDEMHWQQEAAARAPLILLKRDGVVVAAGDIAESADLRAARYPPGLTVPDADRSLDDVRNARSQFLVDLYMRSWNLDWFYRLATNPAVLRARDPGAWVAGNSATLPAPLGPSNVLLMSTATGAADNEIFNALRIEEIRDALSQSLGMDPAQLHIFYGGANVPGANALEVRDNGLDLVRREVAGATPFTPDAALRIFESIHAHPGSRNLLVFIGHGGPEGAGMWGSPAPLAPGALKALHEHGGGDDVLVSGNCFGGVMARAVSCGFFGARPDVIATGCQADAAQVAQSHDYLHTFFAGLAPGARRRVDTNGDGVVSFAEAHWYASIEGDVRNITYTSIDALADAWFEAHPEALPHTISVHDALALAATAPPGEAATLRTLLSGYEGDFQLPLDDLAGQEQTRNPASPVPRILASQLARRLLFMKSPGDRQGELAKLQSCENRSVAAFIKP